MRAAIRIEVSGGLVFGRASARVSARGWVRRVSPRAIRGASKGSSGSIISLYMLKTKMMVNVWSKFMMENLCAGGRADAS